MSMMVAAGLEVFGDSEQALGTNQGVVVYMDAPLTVNMVGSPLPGTFSIERGLTFVGLPRQSTGLQKVSDFLTFYPKVCVVLVTVEGELYLVGRAGDSGDGRDALFGLLRDHGDYRRASLWDCITRARYDQL